jgi:hypothetical protein
VTDQNLQQPPQYAAPEPLAVAPQPLYQAPPAYTPAPTYAPAPVVGYDAPAPAPHELAAPAADPVVQQFPEPVAATTAVEEDPAAPTAGDRPQRTASSAGRDRTLIRRTVTKMVELSETDPVLLGRLSAIVGSTGSLADLVVAVMTATSKDTQPVTDARAILDADPFEAGVVATALGRVRLRQVWRFFVELGVVKGEAPASEPKAAIALVRALAASDTDRVRSDIEQALALLKK